MIRDAVLTEVRANRDELSKECGYDVHALFSAMRAKEASKTVTAATERSEDAQEAEHGAAADEQRADAAHARR